MKTFPELVTEWLAGRDEKEVAPIYGWVSNTIRNWRLGEHLPPHSKISTLAPIFGVTEKTLEQIIRRSRRTNKQAVRS